MDAEVSRGRRRMGREHRISRDARVREESDRRPPRISVALPPRILRYRIGRGRAIAGIDVGEDFIDLAIVKGGANRIRYARVAMPAGGADPIGQLAARIAEAAPELRRDAVVLVDSPRS